MRRTLADVSMRQPPAGNAMPTVVRLIIILAVLAFRFPAYLSTPELRASYDVTTLRDPGVMAALQQEIATSDED